MTDLGRITYMNGGDSTFSRQSLSHAAHKLFGRIYIGFYIVLRCAVMAVRKQALLNTMAAFVDQPPLIFILAMLRIPIGLGIVIAHNRWSGAPAIAVTLIGWIILLRGVALMLVPQQTQRRVLALFEQDGPYNGSAAAGIAFGLWLASAGFTG
jgi:hypothetical protein